MTLPMGEPSSAEAVAAYATAKAHFIATVVVGLAAGEKRNDLKTRVVAQISFLQEFVTKSNPQEFVTVRVSQS